MVIDEKHSPTAYNYQQIENILIYDLFHFDRNNYGAGIPFFFFLFFDGTGVKLN